jgi:hypothetical protein
MALTCDQILAQLGDVVRTINEVGAGGIRSVRDSDGSEIQYNQASLNALYGQRNRLQALYDAQCGNCGRGGSRPFGAVFP